MSPSRSSFITSLQVSLRAAVSAALAVVIARQLELAYPVYAMMAAVIVTDLSPAKTRQLALQRLTGTLVGAAAGGMFSYAQPSGPIIIGVSILVAMLISYAVQVPGAAKLAGFVCGIIMMSHDAHAWSYVAYRVVETLIGIAVALLVSFVPKLMRVEVPD